jgi:hypothetical protein
MTYQGNSFNIIYVLLIALLGSTGLGYTSVLGQAENEVPSFEGVNPGFTPPPESDRTPPPPPSDALTVSELPKTTIERENETDVDPLSVTNRTEVLEILPLNSTKIVKFIDEDLKNSTGVGLAPSSVLENITLAQEGENGNLSNTTILDVLGPQEIAEVTNMTPTTIEGGEPLDLDEVDIATANETDAEGVGDEEGVSPSSATNETSASNATGGATGTTESESEDEEGVSPSSATNETSASNATGGATGTTESESEDEEGVSPSSATNETSASNTAGGAKGTTETEDKGETEDEDNEKASEPKAPVSGKEITSLDKKGINLDLNQTDGILSENNTLLNSTSLAPTVEDDREDSGESESEDSGESESEDSSKSDNNEDDENNT